MLKFDEEKQIASVQGALALRSGLKEAMRVLKGVEDVAIMRLTESDVVRHALVQRIIKAYEVDEERRNKKKP